MPVDHFNSSVSKPVLGLFSLKLVAMPVIGGSGRPILGHEIFCVTQKAAGRWGIWTPDTRVQQDLYSV